jgi:hypothetical protein
VGVIETREIEPSSTERTTPSPVATVLFWVVALAWLGAALLDRATLYGLFAFVAVGGCLLFAAGLFTGNRDRRNDGLFAAGLGYGCLGLTVVWGLVF